MAKKQAKAKSLHLADHQLASLRMEAINVAARLPEEQRGGQFPNYSAGKTADKVVADAAKILAFVMQAA